MSKNLLLGLTSRTMMVFMAGLLGLSYLSIVVNPAQVWVFVFFGIMFIPFFLINLSLLFWAAKRRSRSIIIPLIALLPSLFFFGKQFQFLGKDDLAEDENKAVKIASYNVGRFMAYGDSENRRTRDVCMDSIFNYIFQEDVDIICLQEVYLSRRKSITSQLRAKIKKYKPEYYFYKTKYGHSGNLTISKYPAVNKGVVTFDDSKNLVLYSDYKIGKENFRVYNCHLESYAVSLPAIASSIANEDVDNIKKTETKIKGSIYRRSQQVNKILEHIEASPLDAFVCGDFNDTPTSYTYYKLKKSRIDNYVEAGRGFGATYSKLWPLIRIDYVLSPKDFKVLSYKSPRLPFSDHYPVITEVEIL